MHKREKLKAQQRGGNFYRQVSETKRSFHCFVALCVFFLCLFSMSEKQISSSASVNSVPLSIQGSKAAQDKRVEIRHQIQDRETIQQRWLALGESIRSEDNRRDQFYRRKHVEDTKSIPLNVIKFIGSLKKAVRNIMRHKGSCSLFLSCFLFA
jgi:hypothetical protein